MVNDGFEFELGWIASIGMFLFVPTWGSGTEGNTGDLGRSAPWDVLGCSHLSIADRPWVVAVDVIL